MTSPNKNNIATLAVSLCVLASASHTAVKAESVQPYPDLVITEDTKLDRLGRSGKAVIGSCETKDPLWKGKIALKNVGSTIVPSILPRKGYEDLLGSDGSGTSSDTRVSPDGTVTRTTPLIPLGEGQTTPDPDPDNGDPDDPNSPAYRKKTQYPHILAYVPNNIELKTEGYIKHDLEEYSQQLVTIEIGKKMNKCRNYSAPPVFDPHRAGLPKPPQSNRPRGPVGVPAPVLPYEAKIQKIQEALVAKGYPLKGGPDGVYGPGTISVLTSFFKDLGQPVPRGIYKRPLNEQTIAFLFDALGVVIAPPPEPDYGQPEVVAIGGNDECIKGVNYVPIYLELDPNRQIENENRSNNRVQFTVEIDCSHVAR